MCRIYGHGRDRYVRHCSKAPRFARGARSYLSDIPMAWEMCCPGCKDKIRHAQEAHSEV